MGSKASPQARLLFKNAFDKLEQTINANHPIDARNFHDTTLQDVHTAAKQIEQDLGARQCLRNMRRIEPFFAGLERYSKVVDVLCNGTPYLPWIWAPVRLILNLASDYTAAIEKLVSSYSKIAEALPRFDRLSAAFQDNPEFQRVVATVYADILGFHRESYEFFRKPGWKIFFKTLWVGFDRRFKSILDSLARHSELVDKEASSIDIAEAKEWRSKLIEDTARKERERSSTQFRAALTWLEVKDSEQIEQEDELDRQSSIHHAHSCDWIQKNPKARSWMRLGNDELLLWLNGKPGAGKSVLSSTIIRFLQQDKHSVVLYYFCNYYSSSFNKSSQILRSLAAQLLRSNRDLSVYVYEEYICQGLTSSAQQLKRLIRTLLLGNLSVRIIIDGLDEFESKDQTQILNDITPFASASDTGAVCKVLISSRDINPITKHLSKRSTISLSKERAAIDSAIQSFVQHSLIDIHRNLDDMNIDKNIAAEVEHELIEKADGMFLWVRLVLCTLENVHSVQELCDAVSELPKGLEKIYCRILNHISQQMDKQDCEKATRILGWIALAKRPLKKLELLDGITLHRGNSHLNERTRLWEPVMDLCKPLVEETSSGTIVFIHFTVQEYLLHASEKPFIRPPDAHYDISFACIAYLRTSFELIDPNISKEERMVKVGKGFHALQLYAHEHWVNHLLAFMKLSGAFERNLSQPLMEQLISFGEGHKQIEGQLPRTPDVNIELHAADDAEQDLHYITNVEARDMVRKTLRLRKLLKSKPQQTGKDIETYEMDQDSTLLTQVLYNYKRIVHDLLNEKSVLGLSREQLASFKQHHGSSAFVCRFRSCPRATDGYSTEQKREDHESLQHSGGIKCSEESCSWSRMGFKNAAALRRHMQNFHSTLESVTKPSVVRRKYICGDSASGGASWGCGKRFALEYELQDHFKSAAGRLCILAKNETLLIPDSGNKIKHLNKPDGEPLWRKDIGYEFLRLIFEDDKIVFTNSYEPDNIGKQTFSDLYIDTIARSNKTSTILRDKLLSDKEAARNMAMVCLLVNVGRINTTLNFFLEMRAQLRTYHAIPALQAHQDPNSYKQLQDAPRLKSILKGALEDRPEANSLEKIREAPVPRTSPVNLIFVICQFARMITELHFPPPQEFSDLIMQPAITSKSRARAFLWLMWHYLESDFTEEGAEENPFGPGVDYGGDLKNQGVPEFEYLLGKQTADEDIDIPEEIEYGLAKQKERKRIMEADQATFSYENL